jgi:UDP-arabinose 4-epimerase
MEKFSFRKPETLPMTTILVTGGAGYIGSHTCKALRAAGFLPVTYDNLARGNPEAVQWGEFERGDLADIPRLREAFVRHRPIAVVHFAALAYVGESNENPALYYRNNVGGTAALLDVMREYDVRHIVFSSSCAVYGIPEAVPILEQCPRVPVNPYGRSKMICETMLQESAAAFPLTFMALRYFNAAGGDPDGEIGECHVPETHVIPLLLAVAAGALDRFTILGDDYPTPDGTCIRDYIHVGDLAVAHVQAVRALLNGADSAALNIGTGRGWSVRELVDCVRNITRCDIPVHVGPRRPGDPPTLIADPGAAGRWLGWRPRYPDLAMQVAHAWAWRQGTVKKWQRMQQSAAAIASH